MAQGALCGHHLVNLKQIKNGTQDGQAAADDRTAVLFDAFDFEILRFLCLEQFVFEPVQPVACDQAFRPTRQSQHIGHRAHGAG